MLGEQALVHRRAAARLAGALEEARELVEEGGARRRHGLGQGRVQSHDGLVAPRQAPEHRRQAGQRAVAHGELRSLGQERLEHAGRRRLLARRRRAAGPAELLLGRERRNGADPASPARSSKHLPRRLAPGRGRRLEPPPPEVGDRLRHLPLGRPRLGQPDEDAPRLGMGRPARQEAPRLPLGLRPRAQAKDRVGGRERGLGGEHGVREALGEPAEAGESRSPRRRPGGVASAAKNAA